MLKCHTQVVEIYFQSFRCSLLLQCVLQAEIEKKSPKTPIFGVQGHSRSSTLTPIKSLLLLLVTTSSMSVLICNCFHATQDNCGKITTLLRASHL